MPRMALVPECCCSVEFVLLQTKEIACCVLGIIHEKYFFMLLGLEMCTKAESR